MCLIAIPAILIIDEMKGYEPNYMVNLNEVLNVQIVKNGAVNFCSLCSQNITGQGNNGVARIREVRFSVEMLAFSVDMERYLFYTIL